MTEQLQSSGMAGRDTAVSSTSIRTRSSSTQTADSEPANNEKSRSSTASSNSDEPLAWRRSRRTAGNPASSLLKGSKTRLSSAMYETIASDRPKRKATAQKPSRMKKAQTSKEIENSIGSGTKPSSQGLPGTNGNRVPQRIEPGRAEYGLSDANEPAARSRNIAKDTQRKSQPSSRDTTEPAQNPAKRMKTRQARAGSRETDANQPAPRAVSVVEAARSKSQTSSRGTQKPAQVAKRRKAGQAQGESRNPGANELAARAGSVEEAAQSKSQSRRSNISEVAQNPPKRRKTRNASKQNPKLRQTGELRSSSNEAEEPGNVPTNVAVEDGLERFQSQEPDSAQKAAARAIELDKNIFIRHRRSQLGYDDGNGIFSRDIVCLQRAAALSELVEKAIVTEYNCANSQKDPEHKKPESEMLSEIIQQIKDIDEIFHRQWTLEKEQDDQGSNLVERHLEIPNSAKEGLDRILENFTKVIHEITDDKVSEDIKKPVIFYVYGEIGPRFTHLLNTIVHLYEFDEKFDTETVKLLHQSLSGLESLLKAAGLVNSLLPETYRGIHHVRGKRILTEVKSLRIIFGREHSRCQEEEWARERHERESDRKCRLEAKRRARLAAEDEMRSSQYVPPPPQGTPPSSRDSPPAFHETPPPSHIHDATHRNTPFISHQTPPPLQTQDTIYQNTPSPSQTQDATYQDEPSPSHELSAPSQMQDVIYQDSPSPPHKTSAAFQTQDAIYQDSPSPLHETPSPSQTKDTPSPDQDSAEWTEAEIKKLIAVLVMTGEFLKNR